MKQVSFKFSLVVLLGMLTFFAPSAHADTPVYSYKVVNTYPHDSTAFTQGLLYQDGIFYESTGLNGQSSLRKVEIETGKVLQQYNVPDPQYFGEGITIWQDRIIELTWQSKVGFIYNKDTFELIRSFNYPTEGWGITHDNEKLIMSDGTARLYFWDPNSLAEIGHVDVHDGSRPITELNELEYINGEIYANVWQTNTIARINPTTGEVVGWLDLSGILQLPANYNQRVDVLNGIAYDAATDRLFITGKWWPKLYEIDLVTPIPTPTVTPVISATATTIPTPSAPDLARGLVANYTFNGQVVDESGQNNQPTVHGGAMLVNDRFSNGHNAYQFNGQDAYLEIPDSYSLDITAQLSLSAWLYYETQTKPTEYYTVLEKSNPTDGHARYGMWLMGDKVQLCVQPESSNLAQRCLDSTTHLMPNQWHYVVGIYDGSGLKLYVDNQAAGEKSDSPSLISQNNSPLFIAADLYQPQVLFTKITLDNVRVYNRVLSTAEIQQLYQQIKIYLPVLVK